MNAPAQTLIALPKRLNAAQCIIIQDEMGFDDRSIEIMGKSADAQSHALIRELKDNGVPKNVLSAAISSYWFRTDYNTLLHNTLLIINQLHNDGHLINVKVISNAIGSLTYPGDTRKPHRITTHEELNQAVAITRFITAVGPKSLNVKRRQIEFGSYYAIANPYLETYVRENVHRVDEIISLLKERSILKAKKGLTPVLLALHNDHIKELIKANPEATDHIFDYYRERNASTGVNDITALLEYLNTSNAVKHGYL